jgi:Stage III sporulation protein AE (spore_III_AE).
LKESTGQIVYYAVYGSIIATVAFIITSAVQAAVSVIASVTKLVDIVFPILLTLMAALGGTTSAAVYQPITLIFTDVVVKVINVAVMPMFFATVVFSIIGNITTNIKLDKLTSAIQSIAKWTLSIMFGVIITLVTAQGIVGASADTISVKSAKFALSSYVPILGGYLSEGFDIVMAGALLLKNAVGLAAVILLFIIILAPVIKILVITLMLRLTAGIVEPLADERISGLLYTTSKNLTILIGIVLGMAFLVFLLLMLVVYTFNMGVI